METLDIIILGFSFKQRVIDIKPSYIYKSRLDKAFEIYRTNLEQGTKSMIIITGSDIGGLGISEAKVGFNYLLSEYCIDFPSIWTDVLLEEKARGTIGNAAYTKLILLDNGCRSPIVVSSDYHIERVRFIFDYVYGDEFELSYIASPTNLAESKLRKFAEKEKRSLEHTAQFFNHHRIKRGEHEEILAIFERNQQIN